MISDVFYNIKNNSYGGVLNSTYESVPDAIYKKKNYKSKSKKTGSKNIKHNKSNSKKNVNSKKTGSKKHNKSKNTKQKKKSNNYVYKKSNSTNKENCKVNNFCAQNLKSNLMQIKKIIDDEIKYIITSVDT